ncbi:MAG: hypothetical protein WCA15_10015, partial [Candidatus Acidiferrales bacterium]
GMLAGVLLIALPGARRRRVALVFGVVLCVISIGSCGGGGGGGSQTDPGTPAGTYMVTVTATSSNITRTGTFSVTVE